MSLINYWPLSKNITECIRTEAEELAEHVLLAVHEPMQLMKSGSGQEQLSNEEMLLEHFFSVERPIPVIGKSGVGKSHLIRWIDAKLKLHPDYSKLHVVRIPKNASLRQALELLLVGLDGDEFELARKKIQTVGEKLKTEEVADLLLTFMSHQLDRLNKNTALEMQSIRENPEIRKDLTTSDEQRLRNISKYTQSGKGLSELITDSNFKKNLLNPSHCVYQSASRLTQGASDDELISNDYEIKASDLDFNFNLDDLSLSARQCVSSTQLNTSQDSRETAASILNEVLNDSTRSVFQQLFQFNSGSFQDLFKSIRKLLKLENKTLVVLVEDMAAISAIEDVLIDSLLEESIRDGEQELCTLRSIIAVTDGYHGYLRRQDTIKTRALYEWHIKDDINNDEQTFERIIDFCGRYLNAARYGSQALKESWLSRKDEIWPTVWESDESIGNIKAFGYSSAYIPLFPFNRNAIKALANKFCRKNDEDLIFNPRQILNEILLRTLRDYRKLFESNLFPPTGFASIEGLSAGLQKYLQVLDEPERSKTVSAVWGYDARTIKELKENLDMGVAIEFGLGGLAKILKDGFVEPPSPSPSPPPPLGTDDPLPPPPAHDFDAIITSWFKGDELGQNESRSLRNGLAYMYDQYANSEWLGIREKLSLHSGSLVNIEIPNAYGNRTSNKVFFFTEKDLKESEKSISLQLVTLAILRYDFFNPGFKEKVGWSYEGGFQDYLEYQNFAASWVPYATEVLVEQSKNYLSELINKHIQSAIVLGLMNPAMNDKQRLNQLVRSSESIRGENSISLIPELIYKYEDVLNKWNSERDNWLSLVAYNDHALDGDTVIKSIRKIKISPSPSVVQFSNRVKINLRPSFDKLSILEGCTLREDFIDLFENMAELVNDIGIAGQHYPIKVGFPSSKKFKDNILFLSSDVKSWNTVKLFVAIENEKDIFKSFCFFKAVDFDSLNRLVKLLDDWAVFYSYIKPRLEIENKKTGLDILKKAQSNVSEMLNELSITLNSCLEVNNESA